MNDDDLFTPELPNHAAARFARAGMRILPVDMRPDEDGAPRKTPPYGYAWKQRATSVPNEAVQDFVEAEQAIGAEHVGVAWALGLDRYCACDLDVMVPPDWWRDLTDTAVNPTKHGEHRVFRQPAGRYIGNSTAGFPSQGWGEMRGAGGYIVVWWPGDRPGFDVDELERIADFPHPEWLTDSDTVEAPGCTPSELEEFKHTHVDGNVGRIKGFETKLAARVPGTSRNLHATTVACWIAREVAADLVPGRDAFDALERWWARLGPEKDEHGKDKTRTLTRSEVLRIERWAIAQLTLERIEEVRAKAEAERDAWEAQQKAERDAYDEMFRPRSRDATLLPERFWQRQRHAAVRDAALQVGVSPEALMLAVLVMVAAHVPAAISFPGKRLGAVNVLGTIIGPPGLGKGTTLDRAAELVPLPMHARRYKPGTAQGLVKEFYELVPSDPNDPDSKKVLDRHTYPVLLRVDEVAKFTAATRGNSERGDALIGELKQAVFGEALGQSVATDEKRLQCNPHSYRLVGLLGVAPSTHAGSLFDDTDGGFPQRLLFANLLRSDQEPTEGLGTFDDLALDDDEADVCGGKYVALRPLRWKHPRSDAGPFTDSKRVAARVAEMTGTRRELLDAHVPYLTHAVAAVLAYFDGRWLIQPADLTLAGDVVNVSQAARAQLLAHLARSVADGKKRKRDEQVATAAATESAKVDIRLLDGARAIVAHARRWVIENDEQPTARDLKREANDYGRWALEFAEAIKQGWLREEPQETTPGGSPKRVIFVTENAP